MWSALSSSVSYHDRFTLYQQHLKAYHSKIKSVNYVSFCRVLIMLNSLLNPIIYFWRDKEMRRLVLPFFSRCITMNTSN